MFGREGERETPSEVAAAGKNKRGKSVWVALSGLRQVDREIIVSSCSTGALTTGIGPVTTRGPGLDSISDSNSMLAKEGTSLLGSLCESLPTFGQFDSITLKRNKSSCEASNFNSNH